MLTQRVARHITALLLFASLAALLPIACGAAPNPDESKPQGSLRVALLLETPTGDNDWSDSLVAGLRQAEQELGVRATVVVAQPPAGCTKCCATTPPTFGAPCSAASTLACVRPTSCP